VTEMQRGMWKPNRISSQMLQNITMETGYYGLSAVKLSHHC